MDLQTTYLGLRLAHPILPGASPLVEDLDGVRRLEDAGASAIVMHSLFEEQVVGEQLAAITHVDAHEHSFAEALSYFPTPDRYMLGPDEYLEQIRKIKSAVSIPVIGSLNGMTEGGWLRYARLMQDAGADALELNIYRVATDLEETGEMLEQRTLETLAAVKRTVKIPVAVKLSPFYSALAHFAQSVDHAGAAGLVLFNRFYQADLDVENLDVVRVLKLSDSSELLLRLRWLAILFGRVRCSLAVSGGIHEPVDAVKAIMAGASAVQMVSALLARGVGRLTEVRDGLARWLTEHEYESLDQMRGSLSLERCPDPAAFERANYMHVLQSWRLSRLQTR